MSKKAILQIRQAEDRARVLCRVAEEKAAEILESVEQEGKAHLDETERATEREFAEELAQIRARADALLERKRAEAEREAAELAGAARAHMSQATQRIVWGMIEKCQ